MFSELYDAMPKPKKNAFAVYEILRILLQIARLGHF